ncbi:SlyX family protein [Pelagibaculum spongiae]|uniref:SlyX protein n=1 Tax=Pelagibaculum spongiae TaxID=2080658 RepID=A0A2V1GSF9_9GAMM|nr:SlyX family protein [Pelagibaculum spongiae]PVZ68329.1 SlyX protein [Pelagibaculum spongiae]
MEKNIEDLECRIAFQEATIQELSDQLYLQHKTLEAMDLRIQRLTTQFAEQSEAMASIGADSDAASNIPPHY